MYVAVNTYTTMPYMTILCVASFILLGANHCIADMAYMFLAATEATFAPMVTAILCSTIGNIIGCNMIPYSQ
jgi:formate/nitrite transporter FocA (FNT family)